MLPILICNSDQKLNRYLSRLLAEEGYEVEETYDVMDAINRILTKRYRTLILELCTDGMDGIEALPIINKIDGRLPIVTITDDESLETQRSARRERIFYYFIKPIDSKEIIEVVRAAIHKSCA
jgi:two-component system nitrogen regulation response regulator GlnG